MIETPAVATTPTVRKRKASLQPVKMEDIKIEFVDFCVAVPSPDATVYPVLELDGSSVMGATTVLASPPMTPMEVTFASCSEAGSIGQDDGVKAPRKRRKLDHLSPEEKSQHRKMMNRMSAQSARDRQKALMQQQDVKIKALQHTMESLKKQNHMLTSTNTNLQSENTGLKEENIRLSQMVRELEMKLQQQPSTFPAVIKQEVEDDADAVVNAVFEVVANEDDSSDEKFCSGSSPSEPAVPRTIPLQKGSLEEPLHQHLEHLSCQLKPQPQINSGNNSPAVILLLMMSYLGIWTHLRSCKSLENSLTKFSTEINSSSEKSLSKLKILLDKWLQTHNSNLSNLSSPPTPLHLELLKTEPRSPSRSEMSPG